MKRVSLFTIMLFFIANAWCSVTTHLKVDCRSGVRDVNAVQILRYDIDWVVEGVCLQLTDNDTMLVCGSSGNLAWWPSVNGVHELELQIKDGSGNIISTETAMLNVT